MTDPARLKTVEAELGKQIVDYFTAQNAAAGHEYRQGVRDGLDKKKRRVGDALADAEDAVNGQLDDPANSDLRALIINARSMLEDGPAEPEPQPRFTDHNDKPVDPLTYARQQLALPTLRRFLKRPEDTRTLYTFELADGRRIAAGEGKEVRSAKIMADRLWEYDVVPNYTAKTYRHVQRALLCIKEDEAGISAAEITRGWLNAYSRQRLGEQPQDQRTYNLDDNDVDGDRATVAAYVDPERQVSICWVTGGKFGTTRRLLVFLDELDTFVRNNLKQQIARGALAGRLRDLGFTDERVQPPRVADPGGKRNGRRYWASPDGFTLEGSR